MAKKSKQQEVAHCTKAIKKYKFMQINITPLVIYSQEEFAQIYIKPLNCILHKMNWQVRTAKEKQYTKEL